VGVTSCISSRRQVAHHRADEVSCGPLLEKFASTTAPPRQSRVREKCETGRTAHSLTGVSTMNAIVSHRGSNLARAILGAGSGCLAHTSTNRLHALSTRRHDRRVGDMSRASLDWPDTVRLARSSRPSTEQIDHPADGGLCGVLLIGSSGFAGGSCQYLERHSLAAVQEISVKAGDGVRNS